MAKPIRLTLFPFSLPEWKESNKTGVAIPRDVLHVSRNCRNFSREWLSRGLTPPRTFVPKLYYSNSYRTIDGRGKDLCFVMPYEMKRFMSEGWRLHDGYFSPYKDRALRGYLSQMSHDSILLLYFE